MAELNAILTAYGVSVVDWTQAPAGYMREIPKDPTTGDGPTIVFDAQPKGIAPAGIDRVLAAYGLKIVDAKKLPPSYGREVTRRDADGKEVPELELGRAAYAVSPAEWHQILSAYGQ
jgi:hypothetical protein